jgi:hypothetical protein
MVVVHRRFLSLPCPSDSQHHKRINISYVFGKSAFGKSFFGKSDYPLYPLVWASPRTFHLQRAADGLRFGI